MAKAAELNGYLGPVHVLQLAAQLGVTGVQRRGDIGDRQATRPSALGASIGASRNTRPAHRGSGRAL
jgi:hypothetical protein